MNARAAGHAGLVLATTLFLWTSTATTATYVVRPDGTGDFPTIQAAIEAATHGDTIELTTGVFTGDGNRDIEYHGKALTVRSQDGNPTTCTINCQGGPLEPHRGFYFAAGEGPGSVLQGVKIVNGVAIGNALQNYAGGVYCLDGPGPTFIDCIFSANTAPDGGGAVSCYSSSPSFTNCTFSGNSASLDFGSGGAIYCIYSSLVLEGCTFSGNGARDGGGIFCDTYSSCMMDRTIIAFSPEGAGVTCIEDALAILSCTDVYGNAGGDWVGCIADQQGVNGNISAHPRFCEETVGDYTLALGSACLPENNDCAVLMDDSKIVTASFDLAPEIYQLAVEKSGAGSGTVTGAPSGIDCGVDCDENYATGRTIDLTGIPDAGSALDGWSGIDCPGNGGCQVNMDQNYLITAWFNPDGDGDGASDVMEDGGPNNGDGNNDGTPDSVQDNVATFKDINGNYVTLSAQDGTIHLLHHLPVSGGHAGPVRFFGRILRLHPARPHPRASHTGDPAPAPPGHGLHHLLQTRPHTGRQHEPLV